jgi:hypothetical protein
MAAIYSNGGNRWNILGFNFTERDALSIVYIRYPMVLTSCVSDVLFQLDKLTILLQLIWQPCYKSVQC